MTDVFECCQVERVGMKVKQCAYGNWVQRKAWPTDDEEAIGEKCVNTHGEENNEEEITIFFFI